MKLAIALVVLAGIACAPQTPSTDSAPVAAGPTPVKASFARTWEAAREVLQRRGVRLESASQQPVRNESGMLVGSLTGEFNPVAQYDMKLYSSDCGQDRMALAHPVGDGDAHYSVAVQGDDATSIVHVTINVTQAGEQCTTRRAFEAAAQVDIKSVAEAK